jgi:hypothetical protein
MPLPLKRDHPREGMTPPRPMLGRGPEISSGAMVLTGKRWLSEESLRGNLERPQIVTVPSVRIGSMIQASKPMSQMGHRRCRPRAKLSRALGKAEISAVKNAHIISCAGSDIVRGRRFPGFKQQRHHMVSLAPNSFLMNYGSRQGPLQ